MSAAHVTRRGESRIVALLVARVRLRAWPRAVARNVDRLIMNCTSPDPDLSSGPADAHGPCTTGRRRSQEHPARGAHGAVADASYDGAVDENKARALVDTLRRRGTDAHLERPGVFQFGIRVQLRDGRQAIWDTDGTAGLEAQVMRNGVLVGFVPKIPGSAEFTDEQVVDAIVRTDYDQPIARQRPTAPPPAAPLPLPGGVFRRFLDGFRYR